jgi:chaperonin GroEL (HSP60 family)
MEIKSKTEYMDIGISISDLVKTTLGPRGMNKMIVKGDQTIMTNDGATIIKNVNGNNPIMEIFKNLAVSQEKKIGDGTTTATILAGRLLEKAKELMNRGIHKTTIMNGYNLARNLSFQVINKRKYVGNEEAIMQTTFGSKIDPELSKHLISLLKDVKPENVRVYQKLNSNPFDSNKIKGFVFDGYTINDRMPSQVMGNICVLDLRSNLEFGKFNITSSNELENVTKMEKQHKTEIISKLLEKEVNVLFYTDTNPEFESLLTNSGIMGIVVYNRALLDNICKGANTFTTTDINDLKLGYGSVSYSKEDNAIMINNGNSSIETLIICGSTKHAVEETNRAIDDVLIIMKQGKEVVTGAGSIEIDLSLELENLANQIGGKEQFAIRKFAEAIESIPLILAENCGFDAIEVLTLLKTLHSKNQDVGIDMQKTVSEARNRVIEPVNLKIHAINSAVEVANLILKLDDIYQG